MDTHTTVSPDDFMNFDITAYSSNPTSSSSNSSSTGGGRGSNNSGVDHGIENHSPHRHHLGQQSHNQHQRSYSQPNDSIQADLDIINRHHHQRNPHSPSSSTSSATSGTTNDTTTSMDDAFTALLSMHNVDVALDVNDPSSVSSTSSLNISPISVPLQSLQSLSLPPQQHNLQPLHLQSLNISHLHQQQDQQSLPQLPPFSHLRHSVQQQQQQQEQQHMHSQSHSSSPGTGSGPGTPLGNSSGVGGGGHGSLNLEQQMRLNQLQQLQQLQNQIFQQQVCLSLSYNIELLTKNKMNRWWFKWSSCPQARCPRRTTLL